MVKAVTNLGPEEIRGGKVTGLPERNPGLQGRHGQLVGPKQRKN